MTSLFPKTSRLTGEGSETFKSRIYPIIEQVETIGIVESQCSFFLHLFLPADSSARNHCDKKLQSTTITVMVTEVKKNVLFDSEAQDRRITRWESTTYERFRKLKDSEELVTRKCLDYMIPYQNDLPKHRLDLEHLYNRFQTMFRSISWHETLFQRIEVHEDATTFGQKLISAAVKFDLQDSSK